MHACALVSFHADTSRIGLGPTLMTSFHRHPFIRGPVSKYSHTRRCWGLGIQSVNFGSGCNSAGATAGGECGPPWSSSCLNCLLFYSSVWGTVTPPPFASRVCFSKRLIIYIVLSSTSVFPFSSALQVVGSKWKAYSIHLHLIFLFLPTGSLISGLEEKRQSRDGGRGRV